MNNNTIDVKDEIAYAKLIDRFVKARANLLANGYVATSITPIVRGVGSLGLVYRCVKAMDLDRGIEILKEAMGR